MPGKSGKTMQEKKGDRVVAEQRRQQSLALAAAGWGYRRIGEQLGVSHTQAERDVVKALGDLAETNKPAADRMRGLQTERYNVLLRTWMPRAQAGDARATEIVLRIQTGINKIWGLEAPIKLADADGTPLGLSIAQLVHEMRDGGPRRSLVLDGDYRELDVTHRLTGGDGEEPENDGERTI